MSPFLFKLVTAATLLLSPTPEVQHGWASSYGHSVTKHTLRYRQEVGDVPMDTGKWYGFVAVLDCDRIGETVWIRREGKGKFRPFMVMDCAVRDGSDGARHWMVSSNVLVELDGVTAVKWGAVDGGIRVEVATKKPGG